MRIVVVAGYAPSLVNFRGPLLAAMRAAGHEVAALAPPDEGNEPGAGGLEDALAALGVELARVPMRRGGVDPVADAGTLLALRREFLARRPDLVFAYTIKPVIYGSLAARWVGIPAAALITGLGYAFGGLSGDGQAGAPGAGLGRRVLSAAVVRLYKKALERNRAVVFQNPDDRDLFLQLGIVGGNPGQRLGLVAGSGVDLERFAPAPPVRAHAQTGAPVFLCIARLLWAKGVGVFVEACRLLKERHPGAVCRLLGPMDRVPDAVPGETVRAWREEGLVEVLDHVDDVRPHLAAASVLVLPSFREGTPRAVLEAMAMGRPAIATDVPGCRQAVEDGVTGFLVPPFEPGALMRAMERFVLDPELIGQMGAAGRRLAEERFDARQVARDTLELLVPKGDAP